MLNSVDWPRIWYVMANVGSIAGIAGLVVTGWTLVTVRNIKTFYTAVGALPDLKASFEKLSGELSGFLGDYTAHKSEIRLHIKKLQVVTRMIANLLSNDGKANAEPLIQNIDAYIGKTSITKNWLRQKNLTTVAGTETAENAWAVYEETQVLIISMNSYKEIEKWKAP